MGLLDELKGIVIDQQRAIRERDAKIGTLQESFNIWIPYFVYPNMIEVLFR